MITSLLSYFFQETGAEDQAGRSKQKRSPTKYSNRWNLPEIYNNNRSLFVATRVKKQTKNKVKDLTSKLGTRMETGRLRRDLLGLRVEQPPGLLFNGLI